eukprot:6753708-Prymnesium_polylepis.1
MVVGELGRDRCADCWVALYRTRNVKTSLAAPPSAAANRGSARDRERGSDEAARCSRRGSDLGARRSVTQPTPTAVPAIGSVPSYILVRLHDLRGLNPHVGSAVPMYIGQRPCTVRRGVACETRSAMRQAGATPPPASRSIASPLPPPVMAPPPAPHDFTDSPHTNHCRGLTTSCYTRAGVRCDIAHSRREPQ